MRRHALLFAALAGLWMGCSRGLSTNNTALRIRSRTEVDAPSSVHGLVVERASKEPLGRAIAILKCDCFDLAREVATGEDGRFAIRDLAAGEYELTVVYGSAPLYRRRFRLDDGERIELKLAIPPRAMPKLTLIP